MSTIPEAPKLQARRKHRVARPEILAFYNSVVEYAHAIRELRQKYNLPTAYVLEIDPTNSTIAEIQRHANELLEQAVAGSKKVQTFIQGLNQTPVSDETAKRSGPVLVARNQKRPTKKEALDFYNRVVIYANAVIEAYDNASQTPPKLPFVSDVGTKTIKHILDDAFDLLKRTHNAFDRLQKIQARTETRKIQIAGSNTTIEVVKKKLSAGPDPKTIISNLRDSVASLQGQNKILISLAKEIYGIIASDGVFRDQSLIRQELYKVGVEYSELDKIAACYEDADDIPPPRGGKKKDNGMPLEKLEKKLKKLIRNPLLFCAAMVTLLRNATNELDPEDIVDDVSVAWKDFKDGTNRNSCQAEEYGILFNVFFELGEFCARSLKNLAGRPLTFNEEDAEVVLKKLAKLLFSNVPIENFVIALLNASAHGKAFKKDVILDNEDYFLQFWHSKIEQLR